MAGVSAGTAVLGGFGKPRSTEPSPYSFSQIIKAWSPFLILTALVTVWTLKPFKAMFAAGGPLDFTVFLLRHPAPATTWRSRSRRSSPSRRRFRAVFKLDPTVRHRHRDLLLRR